MTSVIRYRPWLGTLVRLGLGVVWIVAAIDKLKSPRTFVQAVRAYDATPEWLSKAIGYGLPVLEFSIGLLLIIGLLTRMVAIISSVLFVVFLIGIVQASARGIQLECGCFGGGGETTGSTTYTLDILRDLGLLILAAFLVVYPLTKLSADEFLARNDNVQAPSAKRMRTDQGRRKYNAMLESRRQAARSRTVWLNASLGAVLVLIVLIGLGIQSNRSQIQGSLTASHATPSNGVVFGKKAAATVDVYEDFQCPNCLNFEEQAGTTVEAAVRANQAQVHYHSMSFLDGNSDGNRYSSRAANAALCASDISVDAFFALHKVLFTAAVQPKEGTKGRTNAQLAAYGAKAGITGTKYDTFVSCINTEKHKALVQAITDDASKAGVNGTPTILVNGNKITASSAAFTKAVQAADAKGPKPSPSPSTSASSSASGSAATIPATSQPSAALPLPSSPAASSSATKK